MLFDLVVLCLPWLWLAASSSGSNAVALDGVLGDNFSS